MSLALRWALVALLLLAVAAPVGAHSELIGSDPSAGAVLNRSPERVTLRFDAPLVAGSTFIIFDSAFRQVPDVAAAPSAADPAVMMVAPPPLADGQYTVQWVAFSQDGDTTSGSFSFTVRGGGVSAIGGGAPLGWILALLGGVALIAVLLVWQTQRRY